MTKDDIDKAAIKNIEFQGKLDLGSIIENACRESFVLGAEWRINSVWHDAKERPVKTGLFLVRFKENLFDQSEVEVWQIPNEAISSWEEYIEINWIVEYAYIEDLLPNKEDNV